VWCKIQLRAEQKGDFIMTGFHHIHWEFDSVCPHCGRINHVSAPAGETAVRVSCVHCTHGYEYTHIVQEHDIVDDDAKPSDTKDEE